MGNRSSLQCFVLTIFAFLWIGASNASALDYLYCKKGDFTDRCHAANALDDASCKPIRDIAIKECGDYLISTPGRLAGLYYDLIDQAVAAVTSALAAVAAAIAFFFRKQAEKLRKRLLDPFFQKSTQYESLGLNVLIVGAGGSGKTALIRALSGSEEANPNVKTSSNSLYSLAHEVTVKDAAGEKRRLLRIFMSDHVGQDFGTIQETAFYKSEELASLSKCVVFVVDLFAPTERLGQDRKFVEPDLKRVSAHLDAFNKELIRQITAPIRTKSTIILFINKIDKLKEVGEKTRPTIISIYEELIERLRQIPGELFVIAGSAKTGLHIVGSDVDGNGAREDLTLYGVLLGAASQAKF